jgi:hypothetical protein
MRRALRMMTGVLVRVPAREDLSQQGFVVDVRGLVHGESARGESRDRTLAFRFQQLLGEPLLFDVCAPIPRPGFGTVPLRGPSRAAVRPLRREPPKGSSLRTRVALGWH